MSLSILSSLYLKHHNLNSYIGNFKSTVEAFTVVLIILPTSVFSAKPGTINFGWEIAASSDNFSSVACESDDELEHLLITIPLKNIVELVTM